MAKIQDIPIELLALIFKNLYRGCRGLRHPELYEESDSEQDDENFFRGIIRSMNRSRRVFPPEMMWTDGDIHEATKFPFNVANVCKLWQDVVFDSPENWISLAFDLAKDPRPLLGAFAASRSLLFAVSILNTANDLTEEGKIRENNRASSIIQHLEPHAERCTSIVFKLTFASSLPSPVLFLSSNPTELTELRLDYQVYDLPHCYKGTQIRPKLIPSNLKKLVNMSMNGSAFMDIIHLGTKWLKSVKAGKENYQMKLKLHLRDFQFPAPNCDMVDTEYTFVNFIRLLHFLNPSADLHLENLSLAYRPHSGTSAARRYDLSDSTLSSLTFENVSKDFLTEFFRIGRLDWVEYLYFIRCSIPPLPGDFSVYNLSLEDVPGPVTSLSEDDSLYNIVSSWHRGSLSLTACPAFNDEFIRWLCDDKGDGECEAHGIMFLDIRGCENFTAGAIRRLLAVVNDPVKLADERRGGEDRMEHLAVVGRGPPLEEEDFEWFKNYNGETTVYWCVKNEDGYEVDIRFQGTF